MVNFYPRISSVSDQAANLVSGGSRRMVPTPTPPKPPDVFGDLKAAGYVPLPGRSGVFVKIGFDAQGNEVIVDSVDTNPPPASGNDGSAWGAIAENRRQFDATQARLARRDIVEDEQWTTSFDEGKRQFQANYDRSAFVSDRAYRQAEDQFAKNYAENKRQFDTRLTADLDMFDANLMSEEGRFIAQAEANANTERARLGLTAEQMALDASRFDRQSSLEEKKNRQEILRNPSDFISRAFEQRGEAAPTARITHADLINDVARDAYSARQEGWTAVDNARRLAGSIKAPTFARTAPAPRMALTTPAPVSAPAPSQSFGGLGDLTAANAPAWQDWAESYNAANPPRMAEGGVTQANMVMTGDSPKGEEGKENEEMVIDLPNDGGLMVIPKDRLVGKRKRMADAAPKAAEGGVFNTGPRDQEAGFQSGSLPGGGTWYRNPDGTSGMTGGAEDNFIFHQNILGTGAAHASAVSGYTPPPPPQVIGDVAVPRLDVAAPRLGAPTAVSQADLVNDAKRFAPPAVRDLVGGSRMGAFRPAVSALTPRRLSMMNAGEQTALDSYLGVVENTTLQDEMSGIAPLFGPSVSRARTRMAVGG